RKPFVPWQQVLRAAIRRASGRASGLEEHSYRVPARRQGGDVLRPGTYSHVPEVAQVVDTSGSMGARELGACLREAAGVLKALGCPEGWTVAGDTCAHVCRRAWKVNARDLVGGGGTDMGALIARAARLKPRPHVIVVHTDGLTGWGDQPAGIRVVGCII